MRQGTKRHSLKERLHDLYETPPEAVEALIRTMAPDRFLIWEPCAGPGSIVRVLRSHGFPVVATELVDRGERNCPGGQVGVDFFAQTHKRADWIITNPPFKQADDFVRHAMKLECNAIVLLRLAALEGARRADIIEGHLIGVMPFIERLPMMHRDGWQGPRTTSTTPYAWFVFCPDGRDGPVQLERISWRSP